ncbi:aminopeptidase P family protein [Ruminococcus sp. YE282]|uniref:aminopeptidase P family protein n=1 Tax=Ruminococcus sp. YE282 TaxID=3158780 RepID=UPI000886E895|nr:aminopeptidase P family protein [Ruminococcus bromii]MEE3498812.1 aminopeptidase P family protein [Ruminococcus bromii]SCX85674.1 Xaa-Pro aminopeptidase [Ruminococcus bromii]
MEKQFESRVDSLRKILKNSDEAVLLTNEVNVGYFSGFLHSEGVMLISSDKSYLFVDFRYFEAAQKCAENCEVVCFKKLSSDVSDVCKSLNVKSLYFEASAITVARFELFKNAFEKEGIASFSSSELDNLISEIRCIKDEVEIDKIQTAQNIAENAYLETLNYVKPGAKESDIAARLEYYMKLYGAQKASFDLITITGKKTSLPHGVPSGDRIQEGDFFTCDFGAVYDGYCSDTTRTVAVKSASDEMRSVYNIVLNAQLTALKSVKQGALCSDVDNAARNVIKQAGYGDYFGHATGHGVGLEIHEAPTVSYRSNTVLKSGMIITDEPGIYLPNKFGVRIEDMLCVTEYGCHNFVNLPKELIIL